MHVYTVGAILLSSACEYQQDVMFDMKMYMSVMAGRLREIPFLGVVRMCLIGKLYDLFIDGTSVSHIKYSMGLKS